MSFYASPLLARSIRRILSTTLAEPRVRWPFPENNKRLRHLGLAPESDSDLLPSPDRAGLGNSEPLETIRVSSSGVLGRLRWRALAWSSAVVVDRRISANAEEGCSSIWGRHDGGRRWYGVNLVGRPLSSLVGCSRVRFLTSHHREP